MALSVHGDPPVLSLKNNRLVRGRSAPFELVEDVEVVRQIVLDATVFAPILTPGVEGAAASSHPGLTRTLLAGIPTATWWAGTSPCTTARAPTTAFSPTFVPALTVGG
jgi:hypothetical protein